MQVDGGENNLFSSASGLTLPSGKLAMDYVNFQSRQAKFFILQKGNG